MKYYFLSSLIFFGTFAHAQAQSSGYQPEVALQKMTAFGQKVETDEIRLAATVQNGRIKPLATLARETILFLTGSYRKWELNSVQLYLTISSLEAAAYAPIIEIRDIELRKKLGYTSDKKYFSLADLESSPLEKFSNPLLQKDQEGAKLSESEKKVLEAYSQMNLFRQIAMKEHLAGSLDFSWLESKQRSPDTPMAQLALKYLTLLSADKFDEANATALEIKEKSRNQKTPDLFRHSLDKLETEVWFYDYRPFLWAAMLSLFAGLALTVDVFYKKFSARGIYALFTLVLLPVLVGLGLRVYITQFSPVTNMYGTMIWVAFGVTLFSLILYSLYKNAVVCGYLFFGSGLILMLTENIPLVLSPDMDPIVAVLRSNFWLATHVTTITISYAAYTIAMILGNVVLIKSLFGKNNPQQIQDFFQYSYRMVQLGCLLLTLGIILGGIWADYSWGRFWGWDPKETWALIADLGFLVLLHARFIGWLKPFSFLALLPVSYLLVIMAWYGVNFILAAGLHSYGFSSGGAKAVTIFVTLQVGLILVVLAKNKLTGAQKYQG